MYRSRETNTLRQLVYLGILLYPSDPLPPTYPVRGSRAAGAGRGGTHDNDSTAEMTGAGHQAPDDTLLEDVKRGNSTLNKKLNLLLRN